MAYPDRYLVCISNNNVTSMGNVLHNYYQNLRKYIHAAAAAADTDTTPILITIKSHPYIPETPLPLHITSDF